MKETFDECNGSSFMFINHADCNYFKEPLKHKKCLYNDSTSVRPTRLTPYGVAANHDYVCVTDSSCSRLSVYKPSCEQGLDKSVTTFDVPSIRDVALYKSTAIISTGLSIKLINLSLTEDNFYDKREIFVKDAKCLNGICVTEFGFIIVSDNETGTITVCKGDSQWTFGREGTKDTELCFPQFIAWDQKHKRILVADSANFRVQAFTIDGRHLLTFGCQGDKHGHFLNPTGIDVDTDGRIYVADGSLNTVQVFNEFGTWMDSFGKAGTECGSLYFPKGLSVCNGEIFVADSGNCRVGVFG